MQNIATKLWDSQGEIKGVRTVCDGRIVSYDLLVNNRHSTRHRKFLQKIYLPNDESREEVSIPESGIPEESGEAADRRVLDRAPRPGQVGAGPRRSPRLQSIARQGPGRR